MTKPLGNEDLSATPGERVIDKPENTFLRSVLVNGIIIPSRATIKTVVL